MKETRMAYVAGLIDADGSLYISRSADAKGYVHYDPIVMVRTTHRKTAKWLVQNFGGTFDKTSWENDTWKDYYRWKFSSDVHASRFLEKVAPYLWLKRAQAGVLSMYYALAGAIDPKRRDSLYKKIGTLNQNVSVTTNTSRFALKGKAAHAYVAGLFDGEGSSYVIRVRQVSGSGVYYRASLCLGMSVKKVIVMLHQMFGGVWRERLPHNGVLTMYEWEIKHNAGKEQFLLKVLPYLVTKREQSKIVLTFSRMAGVAAPEKRRAMWLLCKSLNGK